jgi:nitroreductase
MNNINYSQIIESLNWRYATKSFDPTQKLTQEQLDFVEESMRLAPSSYGLQAWKFVDVTTPEIREKLKAAGWGQGQYTEASHLFAFCTYNNPIAIKDQLVGEYIADTVDTRNIAVDSLDGYKNIMLGAVEHGNTSGNPEYTPYWLDNQLYLAIGQTMTACAMAGIDTCPMEGFDIAKADEILELDKDGLRVKCFLAVGFRAEGDKYEPSTTKKVRFSKEHLFIQK